MSETTPPAAARGSAASRVSHPQVPARVLQIGPAGRGWALVIHAGAGSHPRALQEQFASGYRKGLRAAYLAGEQVLVRSGGALDAVCEAVCALEDDPLFNAGRGATLDASGQAVHDASVMTGEGSAGAVTGSRVIRHPVLAARAVLERSPHVFVSAPGEQLARTWGLSVMDPAWFVTDERLQGLAQAQQAGVSGPAHGTVGAVALDVTGHLAAATSTGGMTNKAVGRIGDSPVIGAGVYAHGGSVAVSCTGVGEAFLESVAAHEVHSRMAYLHESAGQAIAHVLDEEIAPRRADGGMIAVDTGQGMVVAHNSQMMFAAWRGESGSVQTLLGGLSQASPGTSVSGPST
ncbi:beta-aspartyl-peptidase (threonine type) [Propionibacterium cyclohexanicum]|uniref:Beta-aspartyl-peptidase (Threonine type) n=1 Tax=Propionibacterium cyclohexanicum TaxID=64702 RepID=A0A1H9U136_9ACTN|nr:isoaspartyl peptidase/L-asparaginase [Propionibacterium cyclohexanicum]SES03012.1 beta-aspartyl-peptidase (threonine type) [Propionibacterium cyclohexanicum]